jgi:hypothetical protein
MVLLVPFADVSTSLRRLVADKSDACSDQECDTRGVERFRCARCGAVLSVPLRLVDMPVPPHWSLLDHHHVNPTLLEPGTYAVDDGEHGRDHIVGTFVLAPGDQFQQSWPQWQQHES